MKANRKFREDDAANFGVIGTAAIGAVIGFMITLVLALNLLPTVQDSAAAAKTNPNGTAGDKGIVGLYPLLFAVVPILGGIGGGGAGYAIGRARGA